jgi:LPXTG-motif cell wall-anchored protein
LTTTSLTLTKTDTGNTKLTGAVFALYEVADDNSETLVYVVSDGADGQGHYRKAESETESGALDQFEVGAATYTETAEGGAVSVVNNTDKGIAYITGLDLSKTYVVKEIKAPDGYNRLDGNQTINKTTDGKAFEITVQNSAGTLLPTTGGTGTTVFYVVGGVLVLAALVVLITRKRIHMDD